MNWEAIGAIAEILGSVAVTVTLVLLILQLRSNTVMMQNQTAQNSAESIFAWARQLTGNSRWEVQLLPFGPIYNTPGGRASWERLYVMTDPNFQHAVEQYFGK